MITRVSYLIFIVSCFQMQIGKTWKNNSICKIKVCLILWKDQILSSVVEMVTTRIPTERYICINPSLLVTNQCMIATQIC